MKRGLIIIFVIILILGVTTIILKFDKKPIACPEIILKENCTEGRLTITNSDNCREIMCQEEYRAYCERSDGKIMEVGDLKCGDECRSKDPTDITGKVCSGMYTTCDCGPDKCWDEKSLSCKIG